MRVSRYLTLIGILAVMIWIGATHDQWRHSFSFSGQKTDYYNLLVDGLQDGHLHLKADPHPDLLSDDPAVRANAPYLLDASLYQGRYYLYFGVVPAVMLFLPYAVLTGHDLAQNVAVLMLVFGGFWFQYCTLQRAKARYFADVSPGVHGVAVLLLAFGAGTMVLVRTAGMYEIAIAGGYFFVAGCAFAMFQTLHHPERPLRWLIVASAAAGLAVGCRPPLFVMVLGVGAVALWCLGRADTAGRRVRVVGAAVIPAGVVGLLLMIYNDARFGDPFEFGFNYAIAALIFDGFPFARWSFLPANLTWYYGMPPALTPHFPFVEPLDAVVRPDRYYGYEAIYGQALVLWLLIPTVVGLGWLRRARRPAPSALMGFLAITFGCFLLLLFVLSLFGFRADRYMVDFHGLLVLGLAMAGAYTCTQLASVAKAVLLRRAWVALAGLGVAFNVLVAVDHMHLFRNTRPQTYQSLAYVANHPSWWLARAGFWSYGPVAFNAQFDALPVGQQVPLLTTGHTREVDGWYVTRRAENRLEFILVHHGYGIPGRGHVTFTPGKTYRVELQMGSLFPPVWHPLFQGWSERDKEAAKLWAHLSLDGEEVVNARARLYDASPWRVEWGASPLEPANRFPGRLTEWERPAFPRGAEQRLNTRGVWRLQLDVPRDLPGAPQPLLASGVSGAGNLLILVVQPDGTLQFRLDQWGYGLSESPPLTVPADAITVDVLVWPRILEQEWALSEEERLAAQPQGERLEVWLGDERVWSEPIRLHAASYADVSVGMNGQGFSTAAATFHGGLRQVPLTEEQTLRLLRRSLSRVEPTAKE